MSEIKRAKQMRKQNSNNAFSHFEYRNNGYYCKHCRNDQCMLKCNVKRHLLIKHKDMSNAEGILHYAEIARADQKNAGEVGEGESEDEDQNDEE
uniref:Uncharacterized protein n=1 Tax=Meloidogyne enterolobii TaxID=390850 RepID=A0A6V7X615_MELEN|nr:unnamed protein product [Meloidogyne enterolobii]